MHQVYILLGSNIKPQENVRRAIILLRTCCELRQISRIWETEAYGSPGSHNFLNLVALLETDLSPEELKNDLLRSIENSLGRVRTSDKNAPRTIDLDILIYDNDIHEPHIWARPFIIFPLAELLPNLTDPVTGVTVQQMATKISGQTIAKARPDIHII